MTHVDVESEVWEALREVRFPGMSRDIVSFGFVQRVAVTRRARRRRRPGRVEMTVQTANAEGAARVRDEVEGPGCANCPASRSPTWRSRFALPPRRAGNRPQPATLESGVRHVVAVASGKGGVGKSTVAANLAVRLARLGYRVGLLDADIYGPSIPMMFGIVDRPRVIEQPGRARSQAYGITLMSLGFVVDADTPVIWRGPMVMKAIEQMLGDVDWGELDYLVARPAARHRRRPAHRHAEDPALRRGDRHHAAGRGADRRSQGPGDVPQGQRAGARHRREHVGLRLPALRRGHRRLQARRRRAHRRSSWARRSWAGSRSTRRSSRAATPACRSSSRSPDGAHAESSGEIAEAVVAEVERHAAERPQLSDRLSVTRSSAPSDAGDRIAVVADAHLGGPGGAAGPLVEQLAALEAQGCAAARAAGRPLPGLGRSPAVRDRRRSAPSWTPLGRAAANAACGSTTSRATATSSSHGRRLRRGLRRRRAPRSPSPVGGTPVSCSCTATGSNDRDCAVPVLALALEARAGPDGARRAARRRCWLAAFVARPSAGSAATNFKHKRRVPERSDPRLRRARGFAEGHDLLVLGHFHEPRAWRSRAGRSACWTRGFVREPSSGSRERGVAGAGGQAPAKRARVTVLGSGTSTGRAGHRLRLRGLHLVRSARSPRCGPGLKLEFEDGVAVDRHADRSARAGAAFRPARASTRFSSPTLTPTTSSDSTTCGSSTSASAPRSPATARRRPCALSGGPSPTPSRTGQEGGGKPRLDLRPIDGPVRGAAEPRRAGAGLARRPAGPRLPSRATSPTSPMSTGSRPRVGRCCRVSTS